MNIIIRKVKNKSCRLYFVRLFVWFSFFLFFFFNTVVFKFCQELNKRPSLTAKRA